ncbi:hypothetical protein ACQRBO_15930 [Segatella copri]|uniref:hypothetical protein n=1 Tax=Segatella copri TaxID=165179 RepID=UPI00257CC418|nr:hypothetical protein [Segatella copri]MDV3122798.1 hypothetical protein [Segatella copri]
MEDIMDKAVELTYSYEMPNGLFRKTVRYYNENLIRELLVNSLAHSSRTISNDITIKVYPGYISISNPGGLPLGVNTVTVYQSAEITDKEVVRLMDYVDHNYQLSQKNKIAFGIIAREKRIAATDLSKILQLSAEERLRSYIDNLDKSNLITKGGVKKGSFFQINTTLLKNAKSNIVTSLKTIEPHVLKALIMEDLRVHPLSKISDIAERIPDIDMKEIRKMLYSMVGKEIEKEGTRFDSKYYIK